MVCGGGWCEYISLNNNKENDERVIKRTWVVKTIVRSVFTAVNVLQIDRHERGSTPDVHSSMRATTMEIK